MPWKYRFSLLLFILMLILTPVTTPASDDLSGALRRGDHDTAIRIFTQSLNAENRTPSDQADLYNQRGIEYACMGEFDLAMQDYNQAIQLRPNFAQAFLSRGLTYEEMDQLDRAIQDFEQVIRLTPDRLMGYKPLAWLYASGRDEEYQNGGKALQYAQKAVSLRRDIGTLNVLAAAQARNGQFEAAAETQEEAVFRVKGKKNALPEMLQENEARLALYRSGKPYTLPPLVFNRAIFKKRFKEAMRQNRQR